jgi:hypothetical protein
MYRNHYLHSPLLIRELSPGVQCEQQKGVTCGAATAYPSRVPGVTPRIRVARSLVFFAMFYISLVHILDIALHVPAIDYPFGIFKPLFSDWNDQIQYIVICRSVEISKVAVSYNNINNLRNR